MMMGKDKTLQSVALTLSRKGAMNKADEHCVEQRSTQFTAQWFSIGEHLWLIRNYCGALCFCLRSDA